MACNSSFAPGRGVLCNFFLSAWHPLTLSLDIMPFSMVGLVLWPDEGGLLSSEGAYYGGW
jgi:hypothetical protein